MYKFFMIVFALYVAGCSSNDQKSYRNHEIEFRLAEQTPGEDFVEYQFKNYNKNFYLHKEVLFSNDDVLDTRVIKFNDEFAVEIKFTESGKIRWSEITGNNIGKNMAILVDDKLVTCPIIQTKIDKGLAIINGGFSELEAEEIVYSLVSK